MRALRIIVCVASLLAAVAAHADDWLPVTPEELHMTEEPKAPRAPAIYLYHQVDRDDASSEESVYVRLKILTDEGRKYGDVEIPFNAEHERVVGIEARTIRPDGTIAPFDGKIYDTPIVKARGVRYVAKTFTLGEVQAGSIVEYRFRRRLSPLYIFDSHWILNDDLFTRHGKYTLVKSQYFSLAWSWPEGLPAGSAPPESKHGRIELETHDVPAFVTEEYMPPEDALKQRVDFVYSVSTRGTDFDHFWAEYSRESYRAVDSFIDHRRAMEKALATIVAPGDSPEAERRKIYDRVQRMRNLNFDARSESDEALRDKANSNHDAADVWDHGYGTGDQLTWLFLALLRVAGMEADPVFVSTRDTYFFNPKTQNAGELNTNVIRVRESGNDLYFDPGSAYVPYGMLPWQETGVTGLILAKSGVTWITTPTPPAADSRIEHKAVLHLTDRGSLEGHVTVTYTGLAAHSERVAERQEDAVGRKRDLEKDLQSDIPVTIEVELVNQPDWESSAPVLVAEFNVTMPGWVTSAGSRWLMPAAVFAGADRQMFTHAERIHPIYFSYPYRQDDDVTITLPPGFTVASTPQGQVLDLKAFVYSLANENTDAGLHQTRQLAVQGTLIPVKFHDSVYRFFQTVRSQDEQQVVVVRSSPRPH
jgi:hypothetical protein